MDIFNPLTGVCRGVEADILNHLIHHPYYQSPAEITRAVRRSRNEVLKCLHGLSDGGIITRAKGSGRFYALFPTTAMGRRFLSFADMPLELAEALARVVQQHPETYATITLAPEDWCLVMGRRNLVIVIHEAGGQLAPRLRYELLKTARTEFELDIDILTGTIDEVRNILRTEGIDLYRWPHCRSTKGPRIIAGTDLIKILGGTGGI